MVGDSLRDLQAGAAVGCPPHLVRTGKAGRLDEAELAAVLAPCRRRRCTPTWPPSPTT